MARASAYPFLPIGELFLVIAGLMFVVGSVFFSKGPYVHHVRKGDILYFLGCCIYCIKSMHSMWGSLDMHGRGICEERHLVAEYVENIFYILSCLIFMGACVLYWPGLFQDDEWTLSAEILAVWLFILGSLGFVIASHCNAVHLSRGKMFKVIPKHGHLLYNMAFVALLCAQLGGVFFVAGSFMFRPGFRNHCNRDVREGWVGIAEQVDQNFTFMLERMAKELNTTAKHLRTFMPHKEVCQDILEEGVWLFTVGSALYLAQATIYLVMACIKHTAVQQQQRETCVDVEEAAFKDESRRSEYSDRSEESEGSSNEESRCPLLC